MKLLLTGANGFVGRYAQAALPCVPLPVAQVTDISVDYASWNTPTGWRWYRAISAGYDLRSA
ncbi:hypothetical protein [Acidithiobacillus sp.]|uniref:hypothetical protein n=1 Tax=Acidithiobacillus sp. TaxID=1872118 RepID=UPI0025BFF08A|nr:hypothetical protein [Acidithiobacillus sp.]